MKRLAFRLSICLIVFGACLYGHIEKQNQITSLRIQLPEVAKQLKILKQENTRLAYEIELFESPEHLMELARRNEFSHLKYPLVKEVFSMKGGVPLHPESNLEPKVSLPSSFTLATGAN